MTRSNRTAATLKRLSDEGVSIWLDDLSRKRITSGNLAELIEPQHVVGVTTNPSIFQTAIGSGDGYEEQLADLAVRKVTVDEAVRMITTADVRDAADILRPVYDATGGQDGRVSIEVDPRLAHDTAATIAEAKQLAWLVDRPNMMIKIPATKAGLPGDHRGHRPRHQRQRHADLLAGALPRGHGRLPGRPGEGEGRGPGPRPTIHSVASFFVSRVDTEIDKRLDAARHATRPARPQGQGGARQRAARLRGVRGGLRRGDRWTALGGAAPTSSVRCGPRPASRTRRTRTPCTSTSWSRPARSTPCRRPPWTPPPTTARSPATR